MKRIIQIIPAAGWHATFRASKEEKEEGHPEFWSEPLAVWALVAVGEVNYVTGLTSDDLIEGDWSEDSDLFCRFSDVEIKPK